MRPPIGRTAMKPEQKTHTRTVSARHAAVFTACLGSIVLLATAYWLARNPPPQPSDCRPRGANPLAGAPRPAQRALRTRTILVSRLQEETRLNLDPAALTKQLDPRYRDRLWTNVLALIETWYSNKIDAYLATPRFRTSRLSRPNDRRSPGMERPCCVAAPTAHERTILRDSHAETFRSTGGSLEREGLARPFARNPRIRHGSPRSLALARPRTSPKGSELRHQRRRPPMPIRSP